MKTNTAENPAFEKLLNHLLETRGFDFTGYKRASLERRVLQRMETVGVQDFARYIDYLQTEPVEYVHLFNTILINVTRFLRDQPAWEYMHNIILPKLLAQKPPDTPIRVWSAGTASGEEAYSIAMLLTEHLGLEAAKQRVKIYATDMDEDALASGRTACYGIKEIEDVPGPLREKYFETVGGRYYFHKELRRLVIFGRHDLIRDAPISRIDVLLCRNLLMYFNAETQGRVLSRLHFALNPTGYLFLGKAEMLLTHSNLFTPVELKHRIFSKVQNKTSHDHLTLLPVSRREGENDRPSFVYQLPKIQEAAMEANPVAQIVLDPNDALVLANARARALFSLALADFGKLIQDLKFSYQPVELRSLIDQARATKEPVILRGIPWDPGPANERFFDVHVETLANEQNISIGVALSFADVSPQYSMQRQLTVLSQERDTAVEELESTNEELETTNEELQSTIEELETTNEELQATNEELETMNEELQATNEELETLNNELGRRTGEVDEANAYLTSILSSMDASIVVLNRDYLVDLWNQGSEKMWGLRSAEALGHSFFSLNIALPVDELKKPIRNVLNGTDGHHELDLAVVNHRGQNLRLRGSTAPLRNLENGVVGVIIILEKDGSPS